MRVALQRRAPVLLRNVARHPQISDHLRSEGVRCHLAVPKADHQDRLLLFSQKLAKMTGKRLGNLPVIVFILGRHVRRLQRNVSAHRFSHGPCPVLRLDSHNGCVYLTFLIRLFLDPHPADLYIVLLKALLRLQRKVRAHVKISKHSSLLIISER